MRGEAAIGEQQSVAAGLPQRQHHAHHRVTHVIADRAAAEGQAAENAGCPLDRGQPKTRRAIFGTQGKQL